MVKKFEIDEDDKNFFRAAMRGVRPLNSDKNFSEKFIAPIPKKNILESKINDFAFSDYEKLPPVNSEEIIEYHKNGVQNKILRKMGQGQYNVDAILDLHGMTIEEARTALSDFLIRCQQCAAHFIVISHGKGKNNQKPILKNKLNHWLRQTDQVLAFRSIHRGGALFVLLKKRGRKF